YLSYFQACVSLAKNVGEMRTETELLPQCWEQISHMYEERRLLVAQSCGELAEFVRPEIRDSLILSIVQQLIEDSASVVREGASHNLAMLLPLFPNMDKYFKVEELMFQLVCDPAGVVVETALKELVPAVIKWGDKLDHVLRVLLSHILNSAMRCSPLSGVEGSIDSHLRVLGERERWNVDVLLRMLVELLPLMHQKAIETCPFLSTTETTPAAVSIPLLELYARGQVEWGAFEWMHVECFPNLIQLACLLPQKEDNLRSRISKFLLSVSECFGNSYVTCIMLPVFLIAVGDDADLTFFPTAIHSRIKGLRPRSAIADRISTMCVLPLLLAGVLSAPGKQEQLAGYLRKLLLEDNSMENRSTKHTPEIINAIRFICTFEENHAMIFNILWEMVVSSNMSMKINAAQLLKVIVPYIDAKAASTHVLPALVTLGSDQNLNVKYASIDAFGAVAQHFKNETIVDKIRVQMDAFLDDGSHEATIAVIRALVIAVPHTIERLRDYLLSKIFQLTAMPNAASDLMRRRERADAFCEAIRALDATDLPANSIREFFLPAIQNLLKDLDALDPAHKEALEIIMKERSGGTFETISKVMGAHLGLPSSVSSFFGEGGLLGKKEITEPSSEVAVSPKAATPPADDTRFRRIMMGNFSEMLRGKAKAQEGGQNQ
uniref:RAB11-binding protein RELCH homolog n=1 Tax=Cicer arietinum TaxID=3827 RepID=A0A1S2Z940_CICAR